MPRLRHLLLAVALLAGMAAAAPTTPAAEARVNVAIGLGDQSPAMFASPLFKPLKVKRVRYFIRWDAIEHPHALDAADAYVAAARAAHARVLMHITTNDYRKRRAKLPSVQRYRRAGGALIRRYRPLGVREWGVWNEANHPSEPTWKNPRRAAQFFHTMRTLCRGCTIVALDLLDTTSSPRYIDRFYRALGRRDRAAARIVGIHAYAETNRHVAGRTETIIRSVRAHNRRATFWLTETGGIVRLLDDWRCSTTRAATALRAMFRLAARHRRDIRRVYAYSFFGEQPGCTLRDYGLVTWNGKERKGYRVFRRYASGFAR
jgi:hypothetical protein